MFTVCKHKLKWSDHHVMWRKEVKDESGHQVQKEEKNTPPTTNLCDFEFPSKESALTVVTEGTETDLFKLQSAVSVFVCGLCSWALLNEKVKQCDGHGRRRKEG